MARIKPDHEYRDEDGHYPTRYLRGVRIDELRSIVLEHLLEVAAIHRPSVAEVNPCWGLGADAVGWNVEGSGGLPRCSECDRRVSASSAMTEDSGTDLETVRCYRCQAIRHLERCAFANQLRLPGT